MTAVQHIEAEGRPSTILLVEDDPFLRVTTADFLREGGYSVVEAASGDEATTVLSSGTPVDAVFIDVNLPGAMGGLSLVVWIHNHHPSVPLALTSGIKAVIPALKGQAAVPFLPKPYAPAELLALLSRLIGEADSTRFQPRAAEPH